MTLSIPHPYPDGAAEQWIDTHQGQWERGEGVQLAIERRDDGALVGTIGLSVDRRHSRAELGYFVGVPYWGNGYATEAARAVVDYAFDQLQVNRVYALHFVGNPASGRVLEKVGMQLEGTLREHHHRWEAFRDSRVYGLLRRERA